ncbi:MAG: RtcB family protein [Clostridia bacterium]|nr:RtcB family protein [Clostridia bacterium]
MLEISGKFCTAKIFIDTVEDTAKEQIETLCNQSFTDGCKIRIMPDVHTGAGCVIGFTADLGEKVIPNIVGVDIGCGMLTVDLGFNDVDFERLDRIIRKKIPSGMEVHPGRLVRLPEIQNLYCYRELKDTKRLERSVGTLGGGNHFIEIDVDDDGRRYLVIHSGSRNLGKQVADIYQKMAIEIHRGIEEYWAERDRVITEYKAQGRKKEIEATLKEMKKAFQLKVTQVPEELCYLEGKYRDMYLHDMQFCQYFAHLNRFMMAKIILNNLFNKELEDFEYFETVHNYIDMESNIIRKGAVSAKKDEKLLIPINMRDGSLICAGKGNEDWNCSAPHGAGRLFSRSTAKDTFTVEEFQKSMEGIFSTCISADTLDESPMAYKNMDDIVNNITPTADIIKIIKPVYNFKAE